MTLDTIQVHAMPSVCLYRDYLVCPKYGAYQRTQRITPTHQFY